MPGLRVPPTDHVWTIHALTIAHERLSLAAGRHYEPRCCAEMRARIHAVLVRIERRLSALDVAGIPH